MFNLSSYLEKFKNLKDPKEDKVVIANILSEEVGVNILVSEITIQKGTIFISGSALLKSRVFMKKEEIVKRINETCPNLFIKEII